MIKKVLFWVLSPIWLPLGIILSVIAIAIGLFSLLILLSLPIVSIYLISMGLLSIFSGLIFIFSHFLSSVFFIAQGIFLICIAAILWRTLRLIIQKVYKNKKLKKEPQKIVFKKPIIKAIVCVLIMSLALLLNAKNAFYWTDRPHLASNTNKIYTFYPAQKANLDISLDNVNLEFANGNNFCVKYYGDNIPIFKEDTEKTLEITAINSHPNPKYSINSLGVKNNTLVIIIPDLTIFSTVNISGYAKKINIASLTSSKTNIETEGCEISIASLFATNLSINNPNGNVSLKFGFLRGDSNIIAQNIYTKLFHNSNYAYNAQGNSIKWGDEYVSSPFTYVRNNAEAKNAINLSANQIAIDLIGTFMSSEDRYTYDYLKDIEEELNIQE